MVLGGAYLKGPADGGAPVVIGFAVPVVFAVNIGTAVGYLVTVQQIVAPAVAINGSKGGIFGVFFGMRAGGKPVDFRFPEKVAALQLVLDKALVNRVVYGFGKRKDSAVYNIFRVIVVIIPPGNLGELVVVKVGIGVTQREVVAAQLNTGVEQAGQRTVVAVGRPFVFKAPLFQGIVFPVAFCGDKQAVVHPLPPFGMVYYFGFLRVFQGKRPRKAPLVISF